MDRLIEVAGSGAISYYHYGCSPLQFSEKILVCDPRTVYDNLFTRDHPIVKSLHGDSLGVKTNDGCFVVNLYRGCLQSIEEKPSFKNRLQILPKILPGAGMNDRNVFFLPAEKEFRGFASHPACADDNDFVPSHVGLG